MLFGGAVQRHTTFDGVPGDPAQTLMLADVADSRSNNFRIIRHLAAASVAVTLAIAALS
jgi:hypothetical protein